MVTKLKHYNPRAKELVNDWQVIDASDQILGRLASQVAVLLMGKHKPTYVPHMLTGDFVVVTNATKIKVTGLKAEQKIYRRHSQYPGNLKEIPYARMQEKQPERIIELAVKGMLPKNKLGRQMLKRLKVYAGAEHPHSAQVLGSERREEREAAAAIKAEAAAVVTAAEAKKAAAKKPAAKKAAAPKAEAPVTDAVATEVVEAAETAPAKKAPAQKKKPAAKKPAAKKPAAKKATAKKPAAKKATAKKPAAKKPAAPKKRTTAKKPAAKKASSTGEK